MAPNNNTVGAVMVVGGGVGGMQAALDLANSGYYVYMIEKSAAIGGKMSQLDKTFPTNDCSMCILSPKLVEVGRHINIELLTLTEIIDLKGEEGNFEVKVLKRPRYVDMDKCIACGECTEKCPVKVSNEYNESLDNRKAIYVQYAQAVPLKYGIDEKRCLMITRGRCGLCEKVCPADAINFKEEASELTLNVGSILLAPGFEAYKPTDFETYRYADNPAVLTALEFERILSATGPTIGTIKRLSDEVIPKKLAFLQCVGSRDINRCDKGYCSSVCCMYAIKQAVLAKEHEPDLDICIYYMDIRTFGKDFEKFYENAKKAGVRFVRSRVHTVQPLASGSVALHFVTDGGISQSEQFDMVVLSHGLTMGESTIKLSELLDIKTDHYNFAQTSTFAPVALSRPGVYACGVYTGPKDIPTSVMEASAAAAAATSKLTDSRGTLTKAIVIPEPMDVSGDPPRIGVFICHCGTNIAGIINIERVVAFAKTLPYVEYVTNLMFACSQDSQDRIMSVIDEHKLNRIVVSACSPRTHEPLFQETMQEVGLNKYLFEMANIRNHDSWVHAGEPEKATLKAFDLTEMAVAKASVLTPLSETTIGVDPNSLVIGGGVSGLNVALTLSAQGFKSVVVEKSDRLGGNANSLFSTPKNESIPDYLISLIDKVESDPNITVVKEAIVSKVDGFVGNFESTLSNGNNIKHGVTIIATGAKELKPDEYFYGNDERIVTTLEFDELIKANDPSLKENKIFTFIQCVGSREPGRMYCSKLCCTHSVHAALEIKKINPQARVFILYRDIRTYGVKEDLYKKARQLGVIFIRYELERKPEVILNESALEIKILDPVSGHELIIDTDRLILASSIISGWETELAMKYKIPLDEDGWFFEAHQKLRPVDFATDGMFLAGLAHYPKPMEEAVAQSQAAAIRAVTILTKPQMTVGGVVAKILTDKCSGCGLCVTICPYNAIILTEQNVAEVNAALCKGCGTCSASCRSDAPRLLGFTNTGIFAQIAAAL